MKTFRKISILFLLVSLMNFGSSNIEGKITQIRKDFTSTNAKNGKVYFIFEKAEKYNVPYYVDSKWYKENEIKNGEVFDKRKSKFSEQRYYFDENEKLIRYIGENKKLVENGQKLREIEKNVLNEYYRIKK